MKSLFSALCTAVLVAGAGTALAGEFDTTVPMIDKGAATYYVDGHLAGYGDVKMMVDTGSGYLTINEEALTVLYERQQARYVRKLRGVLANGSEVIVPVYRVSVTIGGNCELQDVEAAVFPGKTRFILGLNALKQASPFIFSTAPPQLVLSHCNGNAEDRTPAQATAAAQF